MENKEKGEAVSEQKERNVRRINLKIRDFKMNITHYD